MVPFRGGGGRGGGSGWYGRGRGRNGYRGNRDPRHRSNYGPRNEPLAVMSDFSAGADPRPHAQSKKRQRGYEVDDQGVLRKAVRGGRIKKNKKPREHEPSGNDLYCEICERFLQDGASKASHDRGREHLKRMEEKREEEDEENNPPTTTIVKTERSNADEMQKAIKEFGNIDKNPNVSQGFKDWVVNSLKEAKRNGNRHVEAIQREIVYTYWHYNDIGKLLSTTWDSMPAATGKCYMNENPTILPEVVFSGSQVEKLYNVAPTREVPQRRPPSPTPPIIAVNMFPAASENESVPNSGAAAAGASADVITPAGVESAPFRKPKITWKLSRSARTLLNYHASDQQSIVLRQFSKSHRNIAPPKPEAVDEAKEESSTEQASAKLQRIKQMEDEQEPELRKLIASTGNLGRAQYRIKQEALFMLVGLLLEGCEFANAVASMKELKATYKYSVGTNESRSESAAHWIVSLLFQPTPEGPLDTALAEIPQLLRKTAGFRYGLRVLRTVLHGEYTQFTNHIFDSAIHDEFDGRSRYLLVPLRETLRMRALLMIGRPAPVSRSKVFQNSPVILLHVLNWLGYHEDGEILWEDANNDFEQAGILILPVKGADPNHLNSNGSDRFVSICNKPTKWRPSEFINSQLIFGFMNRKNAVLPYDDPVSVVVKE